MVGRLPLVALAFVVGMAAAGLMAGMLQPLRGFVGLAHEPAIQEPRKSEGKDTDQKKIIVRLTDEQITNAQIELASAEGGVLANRILVPGVVIPHADRIARVAVKLSGTVAELRKKIGDEVHKDEVVAVLESREVADAKSDYLAARLTNELQQDLFERDKALWDKRVSTEQQFLRSRNLAAQAKMRLNIARQKLFALGLTETEISALPDEPEPLLRRQEVRAPIAGRVAERKVDLGTAVGRDNLETELFVIVDLDQVWVEAAISPSDLPSIKVGQHVVVTARAIPDKAEGKIIFISPLVDRESRSTRVVAELDNGNGHWRPGSFITAGITIGEQPITLAVPTNAIQSINGEKIVFVRTAEGFEKRPIVVGRSDDQSVEVVSGLDAGETIAATNTFLLKAELLKSSIDED
jgi:cobalt-zinc-cadmium efflux system membrane fusion protein